MMTHRVPVRFEGSGSGVEELSWGQRELWEAMRRQSTWMPMGYALPVAPGTTVDDAVAQLRFMMGRYQSMRTRVRRDPDGRDRQVVTSSGQTWLEVVDAGDADDPGEVAEAVRQRFCAADHDFARDWPVRMAVVRHHGVPTHQVVVLSHLVTDGFGALVILREIEDRDLVAGRRPAPPVTALDPMGQARWQGSPAGQRELAAVLRRWEALLRRIPARRFPRSTDPREPRHWQVGLDSPATLLAVRAIRARTTVDTSTILLALFVVSAERGEEIDLSCFFNDRRLVTRDLTEAPPDDPAEIEAALERGRLRWNAQDNPIERLFATINDEADTLDYELFADSHHIAPADLEACIRGMEALAVEAAIDPTARVFRKVAAWRG
ncbi:condensation domain-containing protein [Phytohabitans kaempferiae]|uniref:Condensation domain-containing protein n=1 Tax=Phytohabitans kaempferiae TaxID=1620943 RepID=A0ABV6M7V8_9ACTN